MSHFKGRISKTIITAIICMLMIVTFFPISIPSHAEVRHMGKAIKVGYFQLDGFNDISSDGVFSGYGYEYLMEVSKYTGWEYEFVYKTTDQANGRERRLTYEEAINMLKSGEVDIVCNVRKNVETEKEFLFPEIPLGNTYGVLTANELNTRFNESDISTWKGMTIGLLAGNSSRYTEIDRYLKERNVEYKVKEFPTVEAAKDALLIENTVDAIYTSNLRQLDREKILLRIEPSAFYIAVNKNKQDLCNQLMVAMEEVVVDRPELSRELYSKYYKIVDKKVFRLTQEEKDYIQKNPIVNVGIDTSFIPIEYCYSDFKEKGAEKIGGITGDVLNRISEMTGLTFKAKPYKNYDEATENSNVQMFTSFVSDYDWAKKYNVRLSVEYLEMPISAVARHDVKNYTSSNLKIAAVEQYFLTQKAKKLYPSSQFIYYDTMEECIKAVNSGTADVTFIPTYSADYFSSRAEYTRIRTYATPELNYSLAIAITQKSDKLLYQIIGKAIRAIPKSEINNMVLNTVLFNEKKAGVLDYIYKYPITSVIGVCFFWASIIFITSRYRQFRKKVSREIHLNDERIHIALAQTNMIVWDFDIEKRIIIRAKGSKTWLGFGDIIQNVPECIIEAGHIHPECIDEFREMFEKIIKGEKVSSGIFKISKNKNSIDWKKDYVWYEIKITNIYDQDGKTIRAVGLVEDVTAKVKEELRLRDKASRDPLTNLLNRTSFQAYVQEFLNKEYREDLISALILIDTDDFKIANDTYGHFYGDEVLRGIASRLTKCFRTGDFIGRLGGDEFIIFMKNAKSYEIVEEKAKQICNSLVFEKDDLITTCSVGIIIVPNKYADYNMLYKYADEAMYEAKKYGKCRYVIYDIANQE
ncbi:MAG: diguanylate cyclase domain-containing protein [Aminipila sp.]